LSPLIAYFKRLDILRILLLLKEKFIAMKRTLKVIKIIQLFIFLPFEISKGSKKKAYIRIKKKMISADLL
jgi:hypothetical protein